MDRQTQVTRIKNGAKILFWLGFLFFFVYSFLAIIDFDSIADPRRQENFIVTITALANPIFFDDKTSREVAALSLQKSLRGSLR